MKLALGGVLIAIAMTTGCAATTANEDVAADESNLDAPAPPANFQKVRDGLYRGGHPDAAQLDYLRSIGVKTIVDLEVGDFVEAWPWDISAEERNARARGFTFVRKPMSAFEPAVSDRFDEQIDSITTLLAESANGPIYVHCKHGQDRTGLVIGIERVFVEHWAPADAYAEMLTIGFHPGFIGLNHYFEEKTGFED